MSPSPAEQAFVELIEVSGDWYVRVVDGVREAVEIFANEGFANSYAEGQRLRLGLSEIIRP